MDEHCLLLGLGNGDVGVDSVMGTRTAPFVKPSSVDLSIPSKALKGRSREFRVLGGSSTPQALWVGRMMLFLGWDGKDHMGSEWAQASLLQRVLCSLGGHQALRDVCLCSRVVPAVVM